MRKLIAVLSLALVSTAAACLWLWRELDAERELNATLAAQLQQPAPSLITSHPVAETPPATTAANSGQATPSQSTASSSQGSERQRVVQGTEEDWRANQRRLFEDPRYREAWLEQRRLNYGTRRTNLIRLVGLTPEQSDAVINIQLDREMAWMNKTPDSREDYAAEEAAHQAALRDLVGEQKRERLEEYMESRNSRMQVDRLRSELTEANVLRDDQVEPLISALHAERAQMQESLAEYQQSLAPDSQDEQETWRRYAERQTELLEGTHRRMHAAASGILTQGQLKALDAMLKLELEQQRSRQRMQRLQSKMAPPPPPD